MIKDDLMALFSDFHREDLNLFSLNFGITTLILKVADATRIQLAVGGRELQTAGETNRRNAAGKTVIHLASRALLLMLCLNGSSRRMIDQLG